MALSSRSLALGITQQVWSFGSPDFPRIQRVNSQPPRLLPLHFYSTGLPAGVKPKASRKTSALHEIHVLCYTQKAKRRNVGRALPTDHVEPKQQDFKLLDSITYATQTNNLYTNRSPSVPSAIGIDDFEY